MKERSWSSVFYQVYDSADDILLNTMIEFIGIYCDQPIVKDEMEQTRYAGDEFRSIRRGMIISVL